MLKSMCLFMVMLFACSEATTPREALQPATIVEIATPVVASHVVAETAEVVQYSRPAEGKRVRFTSKQARETIARIDAASRYFGVSPIIRAYLVLITERETSASPHCVVHTRGVNENGLGPLALSLKWNAYRWPGKDEDPEFCKPEVSVVVALALFRKAITVYNVENVMGLQSIFAGRWISELDANGRKRYFPILNNTVKQRNLCRQLRKIGKRRGEHYSCRTPITLKDLGRPTKFRDRRTTAAMVRAKYTNGL